ncbi:ribonuclease H-like domain-containing protein, partial [Tanacetum coccineum]
MKCPEDIKTYSKIKSEQKLFQFLNALDRRYKPIKREILRLEPLPSADVAYATVRKESAHQNILGETINEKQGIAAGLIATETEGLGLVSKVNRRSDRNQVGSSSRDIKTGAIIGSGTEIKGLYYVDEVTQNGVVMLSHRTAEREAWIWHRRLGHLSIGYLHVLFPKLSPSNCKTHYETCVLAKSH